MYILIDLIKHTHQTKKISEARYIALPPPPPSTETLITIFNTNNRPCARVFDEFVYQNFHKESNHELKHTEPIRLKLQRKQNHTTKSSHTSQRI
jgi:hypothetical protein